MDEIAIYLDKEKTKRVDKKIDFGILKAGESTKKSIFVENKINFPIGVNLSVTGEDINIFKRVSVIPVDKTSEVILELSPGITKMKPIEGELLVELNYVVS